MNECREEVYTTFISLQFYIEVLYNQLRLINVSESILFVEGATVSCKKSIRMHYFVFKLIRLIFSLFSSHPFR